MVMKDGKVMVNTLGLPQELNRWRTSRWTSRCIQRQKAMVDPMPTAAEVQH